MAVSERAEGIDEQYVDPVASIDPSYHGKWLAGFAPVKGTEFVVVAQRRHREAATRAWGAAAGTGLVALAVLWAFLRRRGSGEARR